MYPAPNRLVVFFSALLASCSLVSPLIGQITPPAGAIRSISVDDFNLPAQDAAGWTLLTPSPDSRLIYVDADGGDDATATQYAPEAPEVGQRPQSPAGAVRAYKTLAAAFAGLRDDQPDWLLLKAGGVWKESLHLKRGRSASERAVVCAYGEGARPELRTGAGRAIMNSSLVNVVITGIKFWAHTRDTEGPHFVSYDGREGFNLMPKPAGDPRQVRDILIEDCLFRAYTNNVLSGQIRPGRAEQPHLPITRFVLRRSLITGNYSLNAHAQGLYHSGDGQVAQPSVLLQENTFDHNGWRIQATRSATDKADGQATMYNHNTYFSGGNGVIFEKNLFLRGSSMGNKWSANHGEGTAKVIVIDNNLYVEGEIGISMGGNKSGPRRFQDVSIRNNVFSDIGRGRPTNRYFSWGLDAQDWKSGAITANLFIHQRLATITDTYAMLIQAPTATENIVVADNVVANLHAGANEALVRLQSGARTADVLFENNTIQTPSAAPLMRFSEGGYIFLGANRYASAAEKGKRFEIEGVSADLAGWKRATGDIGATSKAPSFPDASRDVEGYLASLGLGTTSQQFLDAVYGQSKATWNPALTAPAINNWLREGFGMAAIK
jgi:hypothetical protein